MDGIFDWFDNLTKEFLLIILLILQMVLPALPIRKINAITTTDTKIRTMTPHIVDGRLHRQHGDHCDDHGAVEVITN